MTELAGQYTELRLNTRCGRCTDERNWLSMLTGVDGAVSIQLALCRTPSCHFFEVRSMTDDDAAKPLREKLLRVERAMRAWRNTAFLAVLASPLIVAGALLFAR